MRFAVLGQGSAGRRHAAGLMALGHEVVGFDPAVADARGDIPMAASLDEALACVGCGRGREPELDARGAGRGAPCGPAGARWWKSRSPPPAEAAPQSRTSQASPGACAAWQ